MTGGPYTGDFKSRTASDATKAGGTLFNNKRGDTAPWEPQTTDANAHSGNTLGATVTRGRP